MTIAYLSFAGGRVAMGSYLEREVSLSNLRPVISDTALPTVRNRCSVSSKGIFPWRDDTEISLANLLHA